MCANDARITSGSQVYVCSESRDQEQAKSDCDQVLWYSDREIRRVEHSNEPDAGVIASECSGDPTDRASQRSQPQRCASRNPQTCAGEPAGDDSRGESNWGGA